MEVTADSAMPPSQCAPFPSCSQPANHSNQVLVTPSLNPRFPNAIVVAVLMVVGAVGNLLVLYVYHFKLQRSVFSTFIKVLAALQLVTTLVSMPIDVALKSSMLQRSDTLEGVCKAAHFEVYSTSLAGGSVLLLIAITRHNNICRPLQPALTVQQATVRCAVILVLAPLLCTVTLGISGLEKVRIAVGQTSNLHGHPDVIQTHTATNTTSSMPDTLTTVPTITIPQHKEDVITNKTTDDQLISNTSHQKMYTEVAEVIICRASEQHKGTAQYYTLYTILITAYIAIFISLLLLHLKTSWSILQFKQRWTTMRKDSMPQQPLDDEQRNLDHMTNSMFRTFLWVTVVFTLSYLPHLVCLIVQKSLFKEGEAVPRVTQILMDLAYNFPYINVVVNPFIYGYRSSAFRSHCLRLLCGCWRRSV